MEVAFPENRLTRLRRENYIVMVHQEAGAVAVCGVRLHGGTLSSFTEPLRRVFRPSLPGSRLNIECEELV